MALRPTPAMPLAARMYALGATTLTVRSQNFYVQPAPTAYRPAIVGGLKVLGGWVQALMQTVGEARRLRAAKQNGQNRGWASE